MPSFKGILTYRGGVEKFSVPEGEKVRVVVWKGAKDILAAKRAKIAEWAKESILHYIEGIMPKGVKQTEEWKNLINHLIPTFCKTVVEETLSDSTLIFIANMADIWSSPNPYSSLYRSGKSSSSFQSDQSLKDFMDASAAELLEKGEDAVKYMIYCGRQALYYLLVYILGYIYHRVSRRLKEYLDSQQNLKLDYIVLGEAIHQGEPGSISDVVSGNIRSFYSHISREEKFFSQVTPVGGVPLKNMKQVTLPRVNFVSTSLVFYVVKDQERLISDVSSQQRFTLVSTFEPLQDIEEVVKRVMNNKNLFLQGKWSGSPLNLDNLVFPTNLLEVYYVKLVVDVQPQPITAFVVPMVLNGSFIQHPRRETPSSTVSNIVKSIYTIWYQLTEGIDENKYIKDAIVEASPGERITFVASQTKATHKLSINQKDVSQYPWVFLLSSTTGANTKLQQQLFGSLTQTFHSEESDTSATVLSDIFHPSASPLMLGEISSTDKLNIELKILGSVGVSELRTLSSDHIVTSNLEAKTSISLLSPLEGENALLHVSHNVTIKSSEKSSVQSMIESLPMPFDIQVTGMNTLERKESSKTYDLSLSPHEVAFGIKRHVTEDIKEAWRKAPKLIDLKNAIGSVFNVDTGVNIRKEFIEKTLKPLFSFERHKRLFDIVGIEEFYADYGGAEIIEGATPTIKMKWTIVKTDATGKKEEIAAIIEISNWQVDMSYNMKMDIATIDVSTEITLKIQDGERETVVSTEKFTYSTYKNVEKTPERRLEIRKRLWLDCLLKIIYRTRWLILSTFSRGGGLSVTK